MSFTNKGMASKDSSASLVTHYGDDVDILDEAATDEVDEPQVAEDEMHSSTHVSVTVKGFCLTGRNP